MFDGLKDIANAKKKAKKQRAESAGSVFDLSIELLHEFQSDPNKQRLQKAADKIIETIKYNGNHTRAYISLAYTFYVLDEDDLALKYINQAEKINSNLPLEVQYFKKKISDSINSRGLK